MPGGLNKLWNIWLTIPHIVACGFWHAEMCTVLGLLDKDNDALPDYDDKSPESEFDSCDENQLSQGEGTYNCDSIATDELSNEHHMILLIVEEIFTSTDDEYGD